MNHFCTYFDHGYLPKGLVMLTSLKRFCPDALVHVLCLSDLCHMTLKRLALPNVRLYELSALEMADPQLAACKAHRSTVEYYWTMTPCLPAYLFSQNPDMDRLTYLDADLFFMSDPRVLFEEEPGASIVLTPHRFPTHLREKEAYGIYNVSWLTFSNTPSGRSCLAWYREKCLEWCYYTLEENRCGDQKYLDYFEKHFSGVHALQHIGAGLAPWNVGQYDFQTSAKGEVTADGKPVVFYHAHAFWNVCWRVYDPGIAPYFFPVNTMLWEKVLKPYARELYAFTRKYDGDAKGLLRRGKDAAIVPFRTVAERLWSKNYLII